MPVAMTPAATRPPLIDKSKFKNVDIEKYRKALADFTIPEDESLLIRADNTLRQHPNEDVEGYFEYVSKMGKPSLSWDVIKPCFLWKIKFVMDEMIRVENIAEEGDEMKEMKIAYDFILAKASEFDAAPFTWQRICELLHTPSRHYKKAIKFLRALDKNINVVTTVTASGARLTTPDWIAFEPEPVVPIEQRFFGRVDELDGDGDDLWDAYRPPAKRSRDASDDTNGKPIVETESSKEDNNINEKGDATETDETEENMEAS